MTIGISQFYLNKLRCKITETHKIFVSDKIGHEIEDFYDEYSSRRLKEQIFDGILQKYKEDVVNNASKIVRWKNGMKTYELSALPVEVTRLAHKVAFKPSKQIVPVATNYQNYNVGKSERPKWPTFEEILLDMGKRYDWKNDRWVKVKVKLKEAERRNAEKDKLRNSNVDIHEKHKFQYKIVKLNKSKSRRNVVVAVSAVR